MWKCLNPVSSYENVWCACPLFCWCWVACRKHCTDADVLASFYWLSAINGECADDDPIAKQPENSDRCSCIEIVVLYCSCHCCPGLTWQQLNSKWILLHFVVKWREYDNGGPYIFNNVMSKINKLIVKIFWDCVWDDNGVPFFDELEWSRAGAKIRLQSMQCKKKLN